MLISRFFEEEIEKISQVARVDRRGEQEYEVRVEVSSQKLQDYQLSLTEVIAALREQNVSIPGGTFTQMDKGIARDIIVRTEGQFSDIEDVKKTVVRSNDLGRPIVLGDIASVSMGLKKAQIRHRVNAKDSIRLVVMKKESADAITLIDKLKKLVDKDLDRTHLEKIELEYINDMSILIRRRLGVLSNNLAVGLFLVVFVLTIFLPFRVSLITAIGIPFSFLGAMWYFHINDISLNLITMMGLIIVIGMLVDDAVVVTENAIRRMEEGEEPMDAAIKGTQQIWGAVFASVMTTVLAFFPMTIMTGIFGKFVSFIPLGVICALIISLFECYFVLPYHVGRWVTLQHVAKPTKGFRLHFDRIWTKVIHEYGLLIHKITKWRWGVLLLFFVWLGVTGFVATSLMRTVLFPPKGIDQLLIKAKAPNGTTLEQTLEMTRPVEELVATLPEDELLNYVTSAGEHRQRPDEPGERGSHYGQVMIYLTPETARSRDSIAIAESLRPKLNVSENLDVYFEQINTGPPVGKPISIGVQGDSYATIMKLVDEIMAELKEIDGVKDLDTNYSEGKEQMVVRVNPQEAKSVGLTAASVGRSVMAAFEGIIATSIKELDDEIDIRVSLPDEEKRDKEISQLKVLNPQGRLISLGKVADFKMEKGIESYVHVNNTRQVIVSGEVDIDKISATEVSDRFRAKVSEYKKKYPGLTLDFGGEDKDTQESLASLGRAFILAFILIYFLLILTFQSFIWPVIIVSAIPIGVTSVVWALFTHGQPFSFMGMLGIVALAGVIVNNAIVYVDFVRKGRSDGLDFTESIVLAGQKRLRPIFLTTFTTVCGIMPTAYGIGGLDPFVVPIAISLGWGMLFGSVLSSFFLPAFIAIFDDVERNVHRLFRIKPTS